MDNYTTKKIRNIKIFACTGILLILLSIMLKILATPNEIDNILLIIGLIFIIGSSIKFMLFKNKNISNKYRIAETDERMIILREKAAYYTFIYSTILLAITIIIFDIQEYNQQLYYIIFILISQYVLYIILNYYLEKNY